MGRAGSHGGQTAASAPAQQADEHGLGLIVGGVTGQRFGRAAPPPGGTGPRLRGWARVRRTVGGVGTRHRAGRRSSRRSASAADSGGGRGRRGGP